MASSGLRVFWTLIVAGAAYVLATVHDLPAFVATNYGGAGVPQAWMTREAYAGYLVAIGILLPAVVMAVVGRRRGRGGQWWIGSLLVAFAIGLHTVILGAHRTVPPKLPTAGFLTLLGLFLVGLVSWIIRWSRAGPPPA